MKTQLSKIQVKTDSNDIPNMVLLDCYWYSVSEVFAHWSDIGQWSPEGNNKAFWRVLMEYGVIIEIYQDITKDEWWLSKVYS